MILTPVGESSVVLSVSYDNTADCVAAIRKLYLILQQEQPQHIVSLRPGLDSLLIEFSPGFEPDTVLKILESATLKPQAAPGVAIHVPVCYETEFGRDLPEVAAALNITTDEVIKLHSSGTYEVWMIGFMPGFPYLGPLDPRLTIPRKNQPDQSVPKGSVAIAEEYTGIYPFDSPGGWYVIGRTPLSLIDYSKPEPCVFRYGMKVVFDPISAERFTAKTPRTQR